MSDTSQWKHALDGQLRSLDHPRFVLGHIGEDINVVHDAIECFHQHAPANAKLVVHSIGPAPALSIQGAHRMRHASPRLEWTSWTSSAPLKHTSLRAHCWLLDTRHDPETLEDVAHNSDEGAVVLSVDGPTIPLSSPLRTRRWDKVSARYPVPPKRRCERVVVVGAGIAGAAVARELAEAGVLVTVLEKDRVASGASGNPAALLEPMLGDADNTPSKWVNQGFLAATAAAERWSLPAEWHWSTHRGPRAQVQRDRVEAWGHPSWVRSTPDGIALRSLVVSPVEWVRTLLDHPRIEVHEGVSFTGLERPVADTVVLANSASASDVFEHLGLRWVRGQLGWTESPVDLTGPLCASKYVLPPVGGKQVWGATFAPDERGLDIRACDHREVVDALTAAFPELPAPEMTGGRASLRGVTNGRLPYVGPSVDPTEAARTRRGDGRPVFGPSALDLEVWLTVGHGSRGFCSAFAAAWLIAESLADAPHRITRRMAASVHPGRSI